MKTLTVPQMKEVIVQQLHVNPLRALFFWGPPGVGKTDAVNQAAAELGVPVVELRLGTLMPADLRGVPVPNPATRMTEWYTGGFLPERGRDGDAGVLFLDEYNQSVPSMQALAQRLLLERRIGDNYRLPERWLVVANGNRLTDRATVQSMPSQTQNRFKHYEVQVSIGVPPFSWTCNCLS